MNKPNQGKTFGAWQVTWAEYQTALSLCDSPEQDPLADAAYQLVRYCRQQVFHHSQAQAALCMIRGGSNALD